LLADHGYALFWPDAVGRLLPAAGAGYGADMFACPA
jgi:hypothetical protein